MFYWGVRLFNGWAPLLFPREKRTERRAEERVLTLCSTEEASLSPRRSFAATVDDFQTASNWTNGPKVTQKTKHHQQQTRQGHTICYSLALYYSCNFLHDWRRYRMVRQKENIHATLRLRYPPPIEIPSSGWAALPRVSCCPPGELPASGWTAFPRVSCLPWVRCLPLGELSSPEWAALLRMTWPPPGEVPSSGWPGHLRVTWPPPGDLASSGWAALWVSCPPGELPSEWAAPGEPPSGWATLQVSYPPGELPSWVYAETLPPLASEWAASWVYAET